ncbi:MAG: hypothetical protein ACFFDW_12730, partial [Candidatus Thorarchaeota archaeon]
MAIIIGGGLGAIFWLILELTNVTNEYAVLGIGIGIGAGYGLLLGGFLLIALRANIVEDYGTGYGAGIGTNIFIGAIIGVMFGAAVGALFGFILELLNFTLSTGLSMTVFGVLVWIALGLNIGVLVGIITSFGFTGIVLGGGMAGSIVGTIGTLAIIGPDISVFIGTVAGIVVGCLIGVFVKFSIRASIGIEDDFSCGSSAEKQKTSRSTRDEDRYYNPWYRPYWYFFICADDDDCGDSDGDCFKVIGGIILPILAIILIVVLISFLTILSMKASKKFGQMVKKGALTAMGSSISIMIIIGANTGLTASFHSLEIYYVILIGAGLAVVFCSILIIAQTLSINQSFLKISANIIEWKDRHTRGRIFPTEVERYDFYIETGEEKYSGDILEYARFYLTNGKMKQIIINCWKIDEEKPIPSNDVKAIIAHYMELIKEERKFREKEAERKKSTFEKEIAKEAFEDHSPDEILEIPITITEDEINAIANLVGNRKKMSITWLKTVTMIPEKQIEEI